MKKYLLSLLMLAGFTLVSSATITLIWENGKGPGSTGATQIQCLNGGLSAIGSCWNDLALPQKTCPTFGDVKQMCPNALTVIWITHDQVGPLVNAVASAVSGGTPSGTLQESFYNIQTDQWCQVTVRWQTLVNGSVQVDIDTELI